MKSFIVSAVVGAAIIGIMGAEAAAIPTTDVKRSDAGSLTERQDIIVTTPCWETSDGQVRCAADKEKRQDVVVTTPCWETSDGQVRCAARKEKRQDVVVTTPCWETSDGQVRCAAKKEKRQDVVVTTPCWETSDGQVRCAADKEKRQDVIVTTPCWETSDGQVRCAADKEKRGESAEVEVYPPPTHVANGTTLKCASWWTVVNTTDQPNPCLAALVSAQDITFAQFRHLNPGVDPTCGNLKVGYAYCIQGVLSANSSTTASPSNLTTHPVPSHAPLFPAVRGTQARSGTRAPSHTAPSFVTGGFFTSFENVTTSQQTPFTADATARSISVSVAPVTSNPSSKCRPVTYEDWGTADSSFGYYDIDSAGHTCYTHQIPPTYGPIPAPTTEANTDAPRTSSLADTSEDGSGSPAQPTASLTAAPSSETGNANSAGTAPRNDGRCGLDEFNQATCDSQSEFGGCCSSHGYCGQTNDHCGAGCLNGCNNGSNRTTVAQSAPESVGSSILITPSVPQTSDSS